MREAGREPGRPPRPGARPGRPGGARIWPEFAEPGQAVGRPRYYPMVCSSEDGLIAEVVRAIDQLAADSAAGLGAAELRSRVASVWAMLAALDPELARLSAAYQPQAGQDH